jgi:hypothetical protein
MCKYKLNKTGNVCTLKVKIGCFRANIFVLERNIQYSEIIVVRLVIQHAVRMRGNDFSVMSAV